MGLTEILLSSAGTYICIAVIILGIITLIILLVVNALGDSAGLRAIMVLIFSIMVLAPFMGLKWIRKKRLEQS